MDPQITNHLSTRSIHQSFTNHSPIIYQSAPQWKVRFLGRPGPEKLDLFGNLADSKKTTLASEAPNSNPRHGLFLKGSCALMLIVLSEYHLTKPTKYSDTLFSAVEVFVLEAEHSRKPLLNQPQPSSPQPTSQHLNIQHIQHPVKLHPNSAYLSIHGIHQPIPVPLSRPRNVPT